MYVNCMRTLSSSIFDFNQVVIFDISVLILFSMFTFFLRLPKVSSVDSSVDISVVSSAGCLDVRYLP